MAVISKFASAIAVMYPFLTAPAVAGSLADIEHVVLFMQGTDPAMNSIPNINPRQKTGLSTTTSVPWPE
jgi:hypothetical protein